MDFDQSGEPRFRILVWENGKHVTTSTDGDANCARRLFVSAVDRSRGSMVNRRVELYDGPDLIEQWSSEVDQRASPVSSSGR
jgi:hypothetical protein